MSGCDEDRCGILNLVPHSAHVGGTVEPSGQHLHRLEVPQTVVLTGSGTLILFMGSDIGFGLLGPLRRRSTRRNVCGTQTARTALPPPRSSAPTRSEDSSRGFQMQDATSFLVAPLAVVSWLAVLGVPSCLVRGCVSADWV